MIEIKDTGIIISSTPFQEKFLIIRCFSKNHGVIAGLIRINKKKNDLVTGNIVLFEWKARLNEQLGYLKIELLRCTLSQIIFESNKIIILNSTISMIKSVMKENEVNKVAFNEIELLLCKITSNDDVKENYKAYIHFEATLLNSCGYGLNWSKCAVTKSRYNIRYISPKTGNAVTQEVGELYKDKLFELPRFLIDDNIAVCTKELVKGLKLIGHFVEKHLFSPHSLKLPKVRGMLIKYLEECS
jgi:DNA repair protein RecO (recombination protein O)